LSRPHPYMRLASLLTVHALTGLLISSAAAQQSPISLHLSAYAVPVWTRVDPVPGGEPLDEVRVVQPAVMVRAGAWSDRIQLTVTADLEGKTIPEGELVPGAFGEGYVDRRHPHTYLHELMLSGSDLLGQLDGEARLSLSLGKGFVAFGTDDPMSRPTLRYPVNHHFSQILERAVGIAGLAVGPVMLEASIFNGDEPERPSQSPMLDRFGDSWAVRLTLTPVAGLELQGSFAEVRSPEHRGGAGLDATKKSLSARWESSLLRTPVYALAEWSEHAEGDRFFVFDSYLVEGQVNPGRHRAYLRAERTERPEETRTGTRFRTVRPHQENSLIGITSWTIHTVGYGYSVGRLLGVLRVEPFTEVSYATVSRIGGGLFRPAQFYGRTTFWAVSLGMRLDLGMTGHRMGRYGVAAPSTGHAMTH
jgi:hypothetical protein